MQEGDEMVVKSTGAIPAPQTEKEYLLTLFQTIFISNLFSAVFSLNLEQLEVVYQQWGSGIPKKHLIQLILIILSCC